MFFVFLSRLNSSTNYKLIQWVMFWTGHRGLMFEEAHFLRALSKAYWMNDPRTSTQVNGRNP
jgi:hypothetical protein